MLSVWGLIIFLVGLFGYSIALGLLICAVLKPIIREHVGVWVIPGGGLTIGVSSLPGAYDILGWWLIPAALLVGTGALIATTRFLRWALRFARIRRPALV